MSDNKTPIALTVEAIDEKIKEYETMILPSSLEHGIKREATIFGLKLARQISQSHLSLEEEAIRDSKKLMHQLLSLIDNSYQRKAEKMIDEHFSKFKPE